MEKNGINQELYIRNAELAVRNKTLSLLRAIDDVTMSSLGPKDMSQKIANVLIDEFSYPLVAVGVVVGGESISWIAHSCFEKDGVLCKKKLPWTDIPLATTKNACTEVIRHGQMSVVTSLGEALCNPAKVGDLQELTAEAKIKDIILLPLAAHDQTVGILLIALNRRADDLTQYESDTFASLLNLVTIALQKAQTYESLLLTTKELRLTNAKLKELDAQKTEFLSIASHQLRTPLAAIRGYVDLMREEAFGEVSSEQKMVVDKIHGSLGTLIELVGQLLNVSRIESGRLNLTIGSVDLSSVCLSVVDFLSIKAKERGLQLVCSTEKVPMVLADAEKLKEVLMNLLENGLKYTDVGGVRVDFKDEESFVRVDISDTGLGLTGKSMEKLFQKFSRVESSTVNHPGTGLGLFVCKKLIDAMGGEIWVNSEGLGKGSTFSFRLPKASIDKVGKKVAHKAG